MKQFLLKLWQDEEGAETAEWLVIVTILVAVALVVYTTAAPNNLQGALVGLVTNIVADLGAL